VVVVVGGSVVVVGGSVVVVVVGARYALRREGRFTARRWPCDGEESARSWVLNVAIAVVVAREVCAVASCSKRTGRPSSAPQTTATTPSRLPRLLCFRRAPPFSGDSATAPTQGWRGGFTATLDNQSGALQTPDEDQSDRFPFPQVTQGWEVDI
jgi:hypothetical protein